MIDFSVTMFSVTIPSLSVQLNVLLDSESREGCRTIHFGIFLKVEGARIQLAAVAE